jgi:thiol-disulfide isomerase/thioredoxin
MNTDDRYKIKLWGYLKKLFKSKGDSILLIGKMLLFTLMCNAFMVNTYAQTPRKDSGVNGLDQIIPLQVGDTVPDELWNHIFKTKYNPSGKPLLKLKEFENKKLIVLDFWATWCGSCIGSIKKYMTSMAYQDNDIAFMGVTYQNEIEVDKFNNRFGLNFPTIMEDMVLKKYFPYKVIPHIVILKDNKVLAIALPEILHQENIVALKNGKYERELIKSDILDYDPAKEISEQSNQGINNAILNRTTVLGPIAGLHGISSYKNSEQQQRVLLINKSLQLAMYELLDVYWHNRIFLNMEKEDQFNYYGYRQDLHLNQWLAKYAVGVESSAPIAVSKSEMKKNALITLLNAKGFDFQIKKVEVPCSVIYASGQKDAKALRVANKSLSDLLHELNYQPIDQPKKAIYIADGTISSTDSLCIDLGRVQEPDYLLQALTDNGYLVKQELRKEPVIEVTERSGL